jgi:hypothetical protein
MERISVNKWEMQTFDMERFHLKKLNDVEINKQYHVKISDRYAGLQNSGDCGDISRECKNTSQTHTRLL